MITILINKLLIEGVFVTRCHFYQLKRFEFKLN
ncbi:MAG: hypothetical protein RIR50_936 [Pseudomonadota bacterium]